ncbi:hypothetical protein GYA19_00655 [Candidatus Beckwithbacteria bacterium]|nr:hypothetical protein [Candidatus Beckwithbacteria bacterium]
MNIIKFLLLIFFSLILFLGIVFIILSVFDILSPYNYRFSILSRIGILKNSKIKEAVAPKEKNLLEWTLSDLEFYAINQETLSPKDGFICQIKGQIITKEIPQWTIKSANNQELSLIFQGLQPDFVFSKPYYDSQNQEWQREYSLAKDTDFDIGNIILIEWKCPVNDPRTMIINNFLKDEYLEIKPFRISRRIEIEK